MVKPLPRLATIGEVAKLLNVPVHRVAYVIRSRPHIHPKATAGLARCFSDAAIAQIRHELHAIDARREGGER